MGKPGRPHGSTTRPQLKDFMTVKEVRELVESAKKKARAGDTNLMKFLIEQIFGKAIQPMEGQFAGEMIIKFDNVFTPKTTSKTKRDS